MVWVSVTHMRGVPSGQRTRFELDIQKLCRRARRAANGRSPGSLKFPRTASQEDSADFGFDELFA